MERVELILYATPTGVLADQCAAYFAASRRFGPTVAHAYPPHCTLTGFFRRHPTDVARIVLEVTDALTRCGLDPSGRVEADDVHGIRFSETSDWVGLELRSPRLLETAERFAGLHRRDTAAGDDAVRLKTWLHLSLAYGNASAPNGREPADNAPAVDPAPYATLARRMIDPSVRSDWEVALWQRDAGSWRRLTPPPNERDARSDNARHEHARGDT